METMLPTDNEENSFKQNIPSTILRRSASSVVAGGKNNSETSATNQRKRTMLDTDSNRGRRLFSVLMQHARPSQPTAAEDRQTALQNKLAERLQREKEELENQLTREEEEKKRLDAERRQKKEQEEEERLKIVWNRQKEDLERFYKTETLPSLMWLPNPNSEQNELLIANAAGFMSDDPAAVNTTLNVNYIPDS